MLAEWQVGEVFWAMLWFTLFFVWIWLLIAVFGDIFRSHDLGGFAKTLWVVFVIVVPYLGVFVYLIARGHKMSEHAEEAARAQDAATRAYIQDAAGTSSSTADELTRLADLKDARCHRRRRVPTPQGEGHGVWRSVRRVVDQYRSVRVTVAPGWLRLRPSLGDMRGDQRGRLRLTMARS